MISIDSSGKIVVVGCESFEDCFSKVTIVRNVLDVGQCSPDHFSISQMLTKHFEVQVQQAHSFDEAIQQASITCFDLILINRVLDADGTSGYEILKALKADPVTAEQPVMLVSNFEDAQQQAIADGAVQGFGKSKLHQQETLDMLKPFLMGDA